ncbi:MAG: biotin transport system substrate-specific component [Actinomycetota bacterium]|nr:biotin transport system substrate-specific component [Actinomycetota bacterium]
MAIAAPQPRVIADVFGHSAVRNAVLVAGGAAFVGLSAQIAFYLPWNPAVPVTLQTFAVVLAAGVLGSLRGAAAMALYALLGSVGLPWFARGESGFGGPAFGYVIGFVVAAFVVGRLAESGATRTFWRSAGLMVLGNVIIYAIGATWLKYDLGVPWFGEASAWAYGVKDFLVGDAIKIAAAAGLLPLTWRLLGKSGLTGDKS